MSFWIALKNEIQDLESEEKKISVTIQGAVALREHRTIR